MKNQYMKITVDRPFYKTIDTYKDNVYSSKKKMVVSVRSYKWEKACKEGRGIIIKCGAHTQTIDWADLGKGEKNGMRIVSKTTPGLVYDLIDFDFSPDKPKVEPVQFDIFQTLQIQHQHGNNTH